MTDYGGLVELDESEKAQALRTAVRKPIVKIDQDSADRRTARYAQEMLLHKKEREEYDAKVQAIEQQKILEETLALERKSQSRNKLITVPFKQVLFEAVQCPYCDVPTVRPEHEKWNPNLQLAGYAKDIYALYNLEQNPTTLNYEHKHECDINNNVATAKRLTALEQKLQDYKSYMDHYFKRIPTF
jgi:hypothetical protein